MGSLSSQHLKAITLMMAFFFVVSISMVKRRFYIDLGYATFGIIATNNVITETAPIGSWMKGMTLKEIRPFLLTKRAKVTEI